MKKQFVILFAMFLLVTAATVSAQKDYSGEAGYVDYTKFINLSDEQLTTEISLDENLLEMAAGATEDDSSGIGDLLKDIKMISVKIFSVNESMAKDFLSRVDNINDKLTSDNWSRIVMNKGNGTYTNVFIKTVNKKVEGLFVMALENAEDDEDAQIIYANVVGTIDMEHVGKLSHQFNLPDLEDMNHKKGDKK